MQTLHGNFAYKYCSGKFIPCQGWKHKVRVKSLSGQRALYCQSFFQFLSHLVTRSTSTSSWIGCKSVTRVTEVLILPVAITNQAMVVWKVDSTIHRIYYFPVVSVVSFVNTYPLDTYLSGPSYLQAATLSTRKIIIQWISVKTNHAIHWIVITQSTVLSTFQTTQAWSIVLSNLLTTRAWAGCSKVYLLPLV